MIEPVVDDKHTVSLLPDDQGFSFYQGSLRCPRASMQISADCPDTVRDAIMQAQYQGWL